MSLLQLVLLHRLELFRLDLYRLDLLRAEAGTVPQHPTETRTRIDSETLRAVWKVSTTEEVMEEQEAEETVLLGVGNEGVEQKTVMMNIREMVRESLDGRKMNATERGGKGNARRIGNTNGNESGNEKGNGTGRGA